MYRKFNFGAMLATALSLCVFILPGVTLAERITVTTYYPSPNGSYDQLQASRFAVGDTNVDGVITPADLPANPGDVFIQSQVGIGTIDPHIRLDVNGGVRVGAVPDADCDAARNGTLRLSAANRIQSCLGSSGNWVDFGFLGADVWTSTEFYEDSDGAYVGRDCPDGFVMTGIGTWNNGQGGHNFWHIDCTAVR